MKIVVLDGYATNSGDLSWKGFEEAGNSSGVPVAFTVYDRTTAEETAGRIGDAEIIITSKTLITKEVLASCPALKYIGVIATGYNVVDMAAAKEHGVLVTNVPGYSTDSVAQMTFALLLEICHQAGAHNAAVHEGRWIASRDYCFRDYPLMELAGKTFGILGLGTIGKAVARIARAFGMHVIAHSRTETADGRACADYVGLDELLGRSDVLSLHCPAFPETTGIIDKISIAKMKDGAILINTSRGTLVVEEDLAEALNTGKIYAAGLDVISAEPMKAGNPLLRAKNCIFTPHIAWATSESRKRLMNIAAGNVRAFIEGKPVNTVS